MNGHQCYCFWVVRPLSTTNITTAITYIHLLLLFLIPHPSPLSPPAFYSWWTNSSFKAPLTFSVLLLLLGNLLYALAYPFNSLTCVLLGRLITGLGGIRAINRRYVADCISLHARTAASAYFVTAGALGECEGRE